MHTRDALLADVRRPVRRSVRAVALAGAAVALLLGGAWELSTPAHATGDPGTSRIQSNATPRSDDWNNTGSVPTPTS
ncbi:hypothetical protein [Streptomyces fuscichromogenes]|uniref:Uncharacterized protein n=1 Tax=Streptomyces fuscichromogenes TaxID=1324013 RepID=A0A918CT11_9ACTN|nr:hypothetical protein [Streptomyces fuscichromogenes]GGN21722.1 hypothetical protein GCM10011578_053060 [Streptomyces fuscichromogenes]